MARQGSSRPPTLTRSIHFYRTDAGVDSRGRPLKFDPAPGLAAIDRLPFTNDSAGRYLIDEDGNAICVWPDSLGALPTLRFCQIRRTGLPQLERAGSISDLNIANDAGLLEPVHVVFFPGNIVGADFNFYGPRLSRLGYYLRAKSRNAVPLATFHPLVRNDVAAQLDHFTELRLFDLKVSPSFVETIRDADTSLGDAFAANARILEGDSESIQVILRPSKDGRVAALRRLLRPIKKLARRRGLREETEKFQVKGKSRETNHVETVDLLHDQLIVRKEVLRVGERSRAIDASSAFDAIRAAHEELGDELLLAASLSP